ncbi:MAG: hypothetical protein U0694_19100 [Anaerolineae bacterium]
MSIIEWLLWLLFLLFFGTRSEVPVPPPMTPTPTPITEPTFQADYTIESVDALILESYPMQLQLQVTGYQPSGCDYPPIVEQSISDTTITVHIYSNIPLAAICPAMLVPYEATIRIDGSFTGGLYTLNVNTFTTQVNFGGSGPTLPTPTPFGVPTGANLIVETVLPVVQSAAPAPVTLSITGYTEDACDLPIMRSITRDGSTFTITLSREIPPNVRCAAGPVPFSIETGLGELLMEGEYTVIVNGVSASFMVP